VDPDEQRRAAGCRWKLVERREENRGVVGGLRVGPWVAVELVLEERVEVGRGLRRGERLEREQRWRRRCGRREGERRA
jgi:hypothetical protein